MSVTRYLTETREGLKGYTTTAVGDALHGAAQVALLGAVGLLAGTITIVYGMTNPNPSRWVYGAGGVATLGFGVAGFLKGLDAQSDAAHAAFLNSAAFRNKVTTQLLDAGMAHITTPQYVRGSLLDPSPDPVVASLEHMLTLPPPPVRDLPPLAPQRTQGPLEAPTSPVIEGLGKNPRSTIIVGQPGAGKGRLVKHALSAVKRHHPTTQVWVLDPKQDHTESHQWASADRVSTTQLPPFPTPGEVGAFKTEAEVFIAAFRELPGPKLLVMDEALAVKEVTGAWFRTLMAGFNALCSTGRSRQHWGWVITQSPNTTDLGLSGGARNAYTRVMLVHADDLGLLSGGSTFFSGRPQEEHLTAPGNRAIYVSTRDEWAALPILN